MHKTLFLAFAVSASLHAAAVQTDWSGGPLSQTAAGNWSTTFQSCENTAWRSIPGQLSLACEPLSQCSTTVVSTDLTKPYTADCGDINGDGYTDILVGTYESNETVIFYGSGNGNWEDQQVCGETMGCCGCDLADINEDGRLDILMGTYTGGRIILFSNQGGTLPEWNEEVIAAGIDGAHDVEAVDLDQDGDLDLVVAAAELDKVLWFRNDQGSWTELEVSGSVFYPCRVHPVDINGDGNLDIAVAGYGTSTGASSVMVMYGSGGSNPSWTEETVDDNIGGAHGVRAADFDGDGDLDLVSAGMNSSRAYLYTREGSSWTRSTIGVFSGCAIVKPADMDGDGDWDVVVSSFGAAGVSWYDNLGSGQWARRLVRTGGGGTSWVIPADMDNNGSLDILAVRFMQSAIEWHRATSFTGQGALESSVLDIDCQPEWAGISWDADVPEGCQMGVQYRSSNEPGDLGNWSEILWSPAFITDDLLRYFQYRVTLNSSSPALSPVLKSIELDWNLQGTSPEEESPLTVANPSTGVIHVTVSRPGSSLRVIDLQGRTVHRQDLLSAGSTPLPPLPGGIYTVVLSEESESIAMRTVAVLPR